jgi:surfeit locus 1 family protein
MAYRSIALLSLVFLPICAIFTLLGTWQLDRMHEKQTLVDQFELATNMPLNRAVDEGSTFARVQSSGRFETDWQLLLDNKIFNGRVGVHVLSLFKTEDGINILVNRGWLPMAADRRSLPEVMTPEGILAIKGILVSATKEGVRLGKPEILDELSGSKLVTYLDMDQVSAALKEDLPLWLIQLDPAEPSGFEGRDWKPAVMLPNQHRAYAFQWFALALAFTIMYFTLVTRKTRKTMNRTAMRQDKKPTGDL